MAQTDIIMVVGAGQMGRGIALDIVRKGYTVLLHDQQPDTLKESLKAIQLEMDSIGDIPGDSRQILLDKIELADTLQDSVRADFIIEAATENPAIKNQIFTSLSNYTTQHTILASNTSSISISRLAQATDCPERVIGLHFMTPFPSMPLVEIVKGLKTSEETRLKTHELVQSLGKQAIEVNDHPGFVSNRLLMPMINEAIFCVLDGVANAESVDSIMRLGMQHPMGPLQLADMIGLDTCLSIMEILHRELDDPKYRPCPLLRNMVKAGRLGRKSGEGFYHYDN